MTERTTLVDGVPVAKAMAMDGAPAISLTDAWEAAYHTGLKRVEVSIRETTPRPVYLFMKLEDIVKAVPRAHLNDAIRQVKTSAEAPAGDDTVETLRRVRNLLQTYRDIVSSDEMFSVFQMAQIHGAPYRGPQVNTDKVDEVIAEADRILGTGTDGVPKGTPAPVNGKL